ncbi:MAG: hypothetical protein JWN04_4419 [Myxococcaceae bacterium]|nr:hypothetical protein [Myxococcaceae bacterium]
MELLNRLGLTWLALSAAACIPDLQTDGATVREPTVLAIIADPPESAPTQQQTIHYSALVADENGVRTDLSLAWFDCIAQKPLAELGPVNRVCLQNGSDQLVPIGAGVSVDGKLPAKACSLFGPNPPTPVAGQPAGRPVDPDVSGGYKIPLIIGLNSEVDSQAILYEQRISCGIANVTPATNVEFNQRYHSNQNPAVSLLLAVRASTGVQQQLAPPDTLQVSPGELVNLAVVWDTCPTVDACGDGVCGPDETASSCAGDCSKALGCGGQERYVDLDRQSGALVDRRELMRVAWYATAGTYDHERTGVDDRDQSNSSLNGWRAPAAPGDYTLWAVLRDSRNGVGYRQVAVSVR